MILLRFELKRIWLQERLEHDTELKQGFLVVTLFLPFLLKLFFELTTSSELGRSLTITSENLGLSLRMLSPRWK